MAHDDFWYASKFVLKLTTNRKQKKKSAQKSAGTRRVQNFVKRMKEAL